MTGHHFQGKKVKVQLAGMDGAYCGGLSHSLLLLILVTREEMHGLRDPWEGL